MPVLHHAIKKKRVDARRTATNKKVRTITKKMVKTMRGNPSKESLKKAFSALDNAAKKGVIHRKKADRLKSRLSRLKVESKTVKTKTAKKKA